MSWSTSLLRMKPPCVVKPLHLCSPKATRSRKRRRDSCFHNLNGYRELRPLVPGHPLPLSFPQRIQWQVCGGEGGRMAVTVQMQFESVVTEIYQDAFVGSSIEN